MRLLFPHNLHTKSECITYKKRNSIRREKASTIIQIKPLFLMITAGKKTLNWKFSKPDFHRLEKQVLTKDSSQEYMNSGIFSHQFTGARKFLA